MNETQIKNLDEYFKVTGQTHNVLFSGAYQYGFEFIAVNLVTKALETKTKIVWETQLINGEDVGLCTYIFQEI